MKSGFGVDGFAESFAGKIESADCNEDRESGPEHEVPVGEGVGKRLAQKFAAA